MGIIIRDKSASFRSSAKGMSFPIDNTGLEVLAVFGGTLSNSQRNFAPGRASLVSVGAPDIKADSVVVGNNRADYFQTGMEDVGGDMTLCLIAMPVGEVDNITFGNYASPAKNHSGTTLGTSLYTTAGTAGDGFNNWSFSRAKYDGSSSSIAGAAASINNNAVAGAFSFMCGRFDSVAGVRKLNNLTTGASVASAPDTTEYDPGQPLRIGTGYNIGGLTGSVEIVAAIGMSRVISDAEMQALYDFWKGYCSRRSITI